eukprot:Lithocolla_globosa_v1_NODE_7966_length_881_cov_2.676755.p2 type:complete len:116 gc:universal NODE_7966_length_881_cov_2.676755:447-100(-)
MVGVMPHSSNGRTQNSCLDHLNTGFFVVQIDDAGTSSTLDTRVQNMGCHSFQHSMNAANLKDQNLISNTTGAQFSKDDNRFELQCCMLWMSSHGLDHNIYGFAFHNFRVIVNVLR